LFHFARQEEARHRADGQLLAIALPGEHAGEEEPDGGVAGGVLRAIDERGDLGQGEEVAIGEGHRADDGGGVGGEIVVKGPSGADVGHRPVERADLTADLGTGKRHVPALGDAGDVAGWAGVEAPEQVANDAALHGASLAPSMP
jgi:hypothetical protein